MSTTIVPSDVFARVAEAIAASGLGSPLPLPAQAKKFPPVGFTGREGIDATPEQRAKWIADRPDGNVAIRYAAGVVGFDGDFYDDKPGQATLAAAAEKAGPLPATIYSTSRNDGSRTMIFRVPEDAVLPSFLAGPDDGVEVIHRGHRYSVVWPSVHPDGPLYHWYDKNGEILDHVPSIEDAAWLPESWLQLLADRASTHTRATSTDVEEFIDGLPDGDYDEDTQNLLDEFGRRLNDEDGWGRFADCDSSQAAMLRITMDLAIAGACGVPGVPMALAAAEDLFVTYRDSRGDNLRDAEGTWRRALAGAIGYVRENGIVPLEPFEVPAELMPTVRPRVRKAPKPRFKDTLLRRGDLANLPQPEPLIEETLDRRTVALLAGYHGTYKSFVALSWMASVATGMPWMGRQVRKGRVLYVVGEGATGIDNRLRAWEEAIGAEIDDDALYVRQTAVQIAEPAALAEVIEAVTEIGFDLVVIDTVARSAVGLEENSSKDMGIFVQAADEIKTAMDGGTVLLVHHTGKDKAKVRGSSAVEAAMDTVYMTEGGDGLVDLKRTKRKDGPMADHHRLRFVQVGPSGVLESLSDPAADPVAQLDRLAVAFTQLHRTFGHIGNFAGTAGTETLQSALEIGRSAARERLADLARDNILSVKTVGRSAVYTIDTDAAVKRWGSRVLHSGGRAENCLPKEEREQAAKEEAERILAGKAERAEDRIVRDGAGVPHIQDPVHRLRVATGDEVQAAARAATGIGGEV